MNSTRKLQKKKNIMKKVMFLENSNCANGPKFVVHLGITETKGVKMLNTRISPRSITQITG